MYQKLSAPKPRAGLHKAAGWEVEGAETCSMFVVVVFACICCNLFELRVRGLRLSAHGRGFKVWGTGLQDSGRWVSRRSHSCPCMRVCVCVCASLCMCVCVCPRVRAPLPSKAHIARAEYVDEPWGTIRRAECIIFCHPWPTSFWFTASAAPLQQSSTTQIRRISKRESRTQTEKMISKHETSKWIPLVHAELQQL